MSGHSKWATIHRQKGINDAKKGAAFTKLAQAIALAVRQGGGVGDPNQNFKLRLAIDKAREFNMPKDNINRAIERGLGGGEGAQLVEMLFEGFAPGGVGVLVEGVSDNRLRTAQQVREIFDKNGGVFGSVGSVSYLFAQVGQVIVDAGSDSDKAELALIDVGATEVEHDGSRLIAYCNRDETYALKDKMERAGYKVESAEMVMQPTTWVEVADGEVQHKVEAMLEKLESLDDVQKVWSNYA